MSAPTRSVILLSGGLDSATVLAAARAAGHDCYALTVHYGQRHAAELDAARTLAARHGAAEHRIASVDLGQFGGSALTDPLLAVPETASSGIPITYVPARNTVMLALALAWAEVLAAAEIHIGANAIDYSGYPDCRPPFIAAFNALAQQATRAGLEGRAPQVKAPLMQMGKADIVRLGVSARCRLRADGVVLPGGRHGRRLRPVRRLQAARAGFVEAGLADPTRYQERPA